MADMVNHPPHYNASNGIECIDVIQASVQPGESPFCSYLHGNVIKYIFRAFMKGNPIQDMQKARWYLNRLIAELEKEEG